MGMIFELAVKKRVDIDDSLLSALHGQCVGKTEVVTLVTNYKTVFWGSSDYQHFDYFSYSDNSPTPIIRRLGRLRSNLPTQIIRQLADSCIVVKVATEILYTYYLN